MKTKKFSYPVLNALKEALANIYFKKGDLKKFVENTIQRNDIVVTPSSSSVAKPAVG